MQATEVIKVHFKESLLLWAHFPIGSDQKKLILINFTTYIIVFKIMSLPRLGDVLKSILHESLSFV